MTALLAGTLRPDPTLVLLKEIHHRVANELQCLFGALGARGRRGAAAADRLEAVVERIGHIAGIHRSIYEASSSTSFEQHCRELCGKVLGAFGRSDVALQLDFAAAPQTEQKLMVSLLCVELVTNALKHSLCAAEPGAIRLELVALPRERLCLVASDSSRTQLRGAVPTSTIVRLLAGGLGGFVTTSCDDGYVATVIFPVNGTGSPAWLPIDD